MRMQTLKLMTMRRFFLLNRPLCCGYSETKCFQCPLFPFKLLALVSNLHSGTFTWTLRLIITIRLNSNRLRSHLAPLTCSVSLEKGTLSLYLVRKSQMLYKRNIKSSNPEYSDVFDPFIQRYRILDLRALDATLRLSLEFGSKSIYVLTQFIDLRAFNSCSIQTIAHSSTVL